MADRVTISHPDIEGTATVMRSTLKVWEEKGWSEVGDRDEGSEQLVDDPAVYEPQPDFGFTDSPDDTADDVADE